MSVILHLSNVTTVFRIEYLLIASNALVEKYADLHSAVKRVVQNKFLQKILNVMKTVNKRTHNIEACIHNISSIIRFLRRMMTVNKNSRLFYLNQQSSRAQNTALTIYNVDESL
jgi:hypothetical protein